MIRVVMLFACAAMSSATGASTAPPPEPEIAICRLVHSDTAGQTRYQLTVDWNGYSERPYRIDLAMTDESGGVYPQFHDQRLRAGSNPSRRPFTVSTSSLYPLDSTLVTLTEASAREFDRACAQDGFCSLNLEAEGVAQLGGSLVIMSPGQAPDCAD